MSGDWGGSWTRDLGRRLWPPVEGTVGRLGFVLGTGFPEIHPVGNPDSSCVSKAAVCTPHSLELGMMETCVGGQLSKFRQHSKPSLCTPQMAMA